MLGTKSCPLCAEPIKSKAIKCKHCKSWLVAELASPSSHNVKAGTENIQQQAIQPLLAKPNEETAKFSFWHFALVPVLTCIVSAINRDFALGMSWLVLLLNFVSIASLVGALILKEYRNFRKPLGMLVCSLVLAQIGAVTNLGRLQYQCGSEPFADLVSANPSPFPETFDVFRSRFNKEISESNGRLSGRTMRDKNSAADRNRDNFLATMHFFPSGKARCIMCGGQWRSVVNVADHACYIMATIKACDPTITNKEAAIAMESLVQMRDGGIGIADHGKIRFIFQIADGSYVLSCMDLSRQR